MRSVTIDRPYHRRFLVNSPQSKVRLEQGSARRTAALTSQAHQVEKNEGRTRLHPSHKAACVPLFTDPSFAGTLKKVGGMTPPPTKPIRGHVIATQEKMHLDKIDYVEQANLRHQAHQI